MPQLSASTAEPYKATTKFTFVSDTPNAKIYYTTNGSTPTTSSKHFQSSFSLPVGEYVLKAITTATGFENSEIFARSIEITENQQQQPEPTDFTVHFKKPSDWEGAYIHYWQNPKSPITEWFNGGAAMTSESNDWYKFTFNESDLVSGKSAFV